MFRLLVVLLALCPLGLLAHSDTLPGPIPAEVIRVVDGDTVRVKAKIWVDQTVEVSVRLRGIDAPEIFRPKCDAERILARRAKATVTEAAPVGSRVNLINVTHDKYGGRVVANILTAQGETLSDRLLQQGEAVLETAERAWC